MKTKQQTSNFFEYVKRKKAFVENTNKILQQTSNFFKRNHERQFILIDVANYFGISLKAARSVVTVWRKFGLVEAIPNTGLPKPFRIIKPPNNEQPHQEEIK